MTRINVSRFIVFLGFDSFLPCFAVLLIFLFAILFIVFLIILLVILLSPL